MSDTPVDAAPPGSGQAVPSSATEPADLARRLAPLFAPHPEIAAVYLFGSVARGDARAESDLDLGVVFKRRRDTALDHYRLLAELAARIEGVVPGRRVDLVVLDSQGPIFRHRVLLEGRRIYESDPERRMDFESATYSLSFDFRPTYELATRGKIAALRRWARDYIGDARRGRGES